MLNELELAAAEWRNVLDRQQTELAADEAKHERLREFLGRQAAEFPEMAGCCTSIIEASGRMLAKRRAGLAEGIAEFCEETGARVTLN